MIDILKPILDIYDVKKDVLLFYLDNSVRTKVEDYAYEGDDMELFLNDTIYCIDRDTLSLDHVGKIIAIKDDVVSIKKQYKYSAHLRSCDYHIFIKRRKTKGNERDFYKALLDTL